MDRRSTDLNLSFDLSDSLDFDDWSYSSSDNYSSNETFSSFLSIEDTTSNCFLDNYDQNSSQTFLSSLEPITITVACDDEKTITFDPKKDQFKTNPSFIQSPTTKVSSTNRTTTTTTTTNNNNITTKEEFTQPAQIPLFSPQSQLLSPNRVFETESQRKEKNRETSRRSRHKKKMYLETLHERLKQLESVFMVAQTHMQNLATENNKLKIEQENLQGLLKVALDENVRLNSVVLNQAKNHSSSSAAAATATTTTTNNTQKTWSQ